MAFDLNKHAGEGLTDLDLAEEMPLLVLCQSGSAEIKKSHKDHAKRKVDGAEEGDIVLRSIKEVIPQPAKIIVMESKTLYVEWDEDGKLVGHHDKSVLAHPDYVEGEDEKGKFKRTLNGHDLVQTYYFGVKVEVEKEEGPEWVKAILPMSRSAVPVARIWNEYLSKLEIGGVRAPIYCAIWDLETDFSHGEDKEGNKFSWSNWMVSPEPTMLDLDQDEELLISLSEDRKEFALPSPKEQKALTDDVV